MHVFMIGQVYYEAGKDYKTAQNSLTSSTHDKTETFIMISVSVDNPIGIFSIIGAHMKEQS